MIKLNYEIKAWQLKCFSDLGLAIVKKQAFINLTISKFLTLKIN